MLTVLWHDEESAGYTDLFPDDWFSKEGSRLGRTHDVRGPQSGIYKAKCNVRIHGSRANLDYEAYADFNSKQGMCLGIMRIQFETKVRSVVTQVWWKDKDSKNFQPCSTTIGHEPPAVREQLEDTDLLEISDEEGRKKLATHLRRERSPKLVAAKKESVLAKSGTLACEACGFRFEDQYGTLGKGYCEVHHRRQLANGKIRKTTLKDLAILCSNCHRIIHRTKPMVSVESFATTCLTTPSTATRKSGARRQRGGYKNLRANTPETS